MKKPLRSLTALFLALLMLAGCSTSPAHDIVTQAGKQLCTAASEAPSASDSDSAEIPSPSPTSTPTAAPTAEPEPEPTPEPEPLALTDGVVLGRRVFVHENGVAFWGAEEYICSALLDSAGNLYDFCVEGLTNTRIVGSAILDSYYYMSTYDGIFRFALADLQTGNNGSELLCDDTAYDGFSIYNGAIYYQDDDALLTLPIDGGEPQTILSGIEDCEITNQGIFYTNMTEGLYLMDPDTRDSKRLIDCPAGCHIALRDSTFYLWASREVLQYNYATGATRSLTLAHEPDMEEHIWPSAGDTLVYTGTDDEIYSYDLSSDSEITLSSFSTLPDKGQGCFPSNVLYYIYTDTVYWDDVIAVEKGKMDLDDFATVNATPTPAPSSVPSSFSLGNHLVSVEYDDCFDVVNDYFMITMPKSPAWAAELVDDNTLRFYYIPGRDAGYDGTFLTIMAKDLSEEASLDYPAYSIAGRDSQKLYVALFSTDLRYDSTSDTQREEFTYLRDYVLQISEGAVTSPFQIAR